VIAPPLLTALPALQIPWAPLGQWPTPLQPAPGVDGLLLKREDTSHSLYGGNKIRTLEMILSQAKSKGHRRIWSIGAYGSNHALAAALHAPRLGLKTGAILFPQPVSRTALANLEALMSTDCVIRPLTSVVSMPLWAIASKVAKTDGVPDAVMVPGGAVPHGALGHVGAALEVLEQIAALGSPQPRHLVLPVGSTCTTAGLVVGMALAAKLGWHVPPHPIRIHAVRVTPWPVTATFRILALARRTAAYLHALGGPRLDAAALGDHLQVHGGYIGRGYGRATKDGRRSALRLQATGEVQIDQVYASKAASCALDILDRGEGPVVFWSTKSLSPLPRATDESIATAPWLLRWWMARARRAAPFLV
jgi:1-aminocyclopropane-1-carboxylate deaminase/D-cysteine desulfhydrase-like pyridoxal-dependent ACC family enzyme